MVAVVAEEPDVPLVEREPQRPGLALDYLGPSGLPGARQADHEVQDGQWRASFGCGLPTFSEVMINAQPLDRN